MTLNCERHGPYEEEFEFTWNHTFPGDETDLGSEPFDFVCYFLKYPGDARKLQQFIEPYAYVRHRYAKCYGNAVFAPKFVARNNLHVHRGMAGKRGDKAVDDLLARERGFSELVSRVCKKLDKSGEGSIQAENLSSIMSDEEFNSHFSNPLTEAGLRTWWAKGAKGPLLNHIRELTQSDKSILRFFSREIKAFVDPSYYDYNELNRRNISFQLGEEFEVRTSLEMDIKWGLTDEARQAHATELCLDRYAREHVITLYFNLKPGVDVESLKTKINNFIMHLTSARGCIDTRHVGKMVGALLAGPNIYCKVIDNRLALSFSQDVVMAIAGASRNEYNTFHSWYKDFLQIPAVQQTLSGKIETSFSPQTILEQPDVPIFELILQNIKASVKARIWKGWRTFLFEYEKAIPGNIAPIMAWFMLGKADIDVKANSYSDLNSAYIEKLFTKKWPLSMPCYSHIIKRIKQRYNRFIHKHTYLKGISDFIFQNLETEEIEMKVFLQNLQANATLKTQGLEQLLSLKQFEGVDFSKYFN